MFGVNNIVMYLQGLGIDSSNILVSESPEKSADPSKSLYTVAVSGDNADDLLKQAKEQLDRPDTHSVYMDAIEVLTRVVKVNPGLLQISICLK